MNWSAMFGFLAAVCLAMAISHHSVSKDTGDRAHQYWMGGYFLAFVIFGALCFLFWGRS